MKLSTALKDQELIDLTRQGNTQAFEMLLGRHQQRVFIAVFTIMKDWHLTEDLLQEIDLKIFRSLLDGRYKEQGKFLPWALRIARNYCFDHKRTSKTGLIKYMDHFKDDHLYEDSPESQMIRKEDQRLINNLLEYLPEEQKKVLIYRHYEGLSFKQIAALSHCSISTALGRMRYALINLRKLMYNTPSSQRA